MNKHLPIPRFAQIHYIQYSKNPCKFKCFFLISPDLRIHTPLLPDLPLPPEAHQCLNAMRYIFPAFPDSNRLLLRFPVLREVRRAHSHSQSPAIFPCIYRNVSAFKIRSHPVSVLVRCEISSSVFPAYSVSSVCSSSFSCNASRALDGSSIRQTSGFRRRIRAMPILWRSPVSYTHLTLPTNSLV